MSRLNANKIYISITALVLLCPIQSFALNVGPCDTVTINLALVEVTLCDGECAQIEAYPGFELYSWSNGQTGSSLIICDQGNYSVTVTDANGCTGVGKIEVQTDSQSVETIAGEFCLGGFVEINGMIYDVPGTYTEILVSTAGCDSILIINITEVPAVTETIDISYCTGDTVCIHGICYYATGSYTQFLKSPRGGCDTIVTITVTERPLEFKVYVDAICLDDSIFFDNMWISEAGTHIDTVPSQTDGCDTVVILELNLDTEQTPTVDITPDSGTGTGRIELYDNACFTYAWSNGGQGPIIKNLSMGDYTVTITSDTGYEEIITYSVPGPLDDLDIARDVELEAYPNPFSLGFNLTIPDDVIEPQAQVLVADCLGRVVYSGHVDRNPVVDIGSELQPGLYLVFLISREEVLASARVVKIE